MDITTCYANSSQSRYMTSSSMVTLIGRKDERLPSNTFYLVEKASCGIAMEIAKADSRTDWEQMMLHINDSIRYPILNKLKPRFYEWVLCFVKI